MNRQELEKHYNSLLEEIKEQEDEFLRLPIEERIMTEWDHLKKTRNQIMSERDLALKALRDLELDELKLKNEESLIGNTEILTRKVESELGKGYKFK